MGLPQAECSRRPPQEKLKPTGHSVWSRRPWAEAQRHLAMLRPLELQSIQLLGSRGPPVRHQGSHSHLLALGSLDVERALDCL